MYPEETPTAFAYEAITVANTAIGFTTATIAPGGGTPAVRAVVTLETDEIRYRYDGTDPTATEGHLMTNGSGILIIEGGQNINAFRAIRRNATSATMRVTYER